MLTTTLHPAFQTPIESEIDGKAVNTNALLSDLLQSPGALTDIAREHKLILQQLIVWCDQPAVRTLLDQADALAARIAAHKTAQGRPAAVPALATHAQLWETVKDRETAGRAARSLLRIPIADPPSDQPTGEIIIPRPSRPRFRKSNIHRAAPPAPPADSLRIPVYRFRLGPPTNSAVGPITPYEIVESDTPANMGKAAILQAFAGTAAPARTKPGRIAEGASGNTGEVAPPPSGLTPPGCN